MTDNSNVRLNWFSCYKIDAYHMTENIHSSDFNVQAGDVYLRKFNKQLNKMLLAAYLTIKMQSGVDSN